MDDPHISAEALAAYLTRTSDPREQERIEMHLVVCDACRAEVVSAGRPLPEPSRYRWLASAGVIAAGLAAVLLVAPGRRSPATLDEPVLRSTSQAEDVGVQSITIRTPADDASVDPGALVFSWAPVQGEALYVVSVVDRNGDVVWEERTLDPSLEWPRARTLPPGEPFFWFVDALIDGVRSATTGVHVFVVR